MKLRYFKISSPFRGLPVGFSLQFRQNNYYPSDNDEPVCLVGLNGSGKSNSLEVLSELFYYLELQTIATDKALEIIRTRYAFLDFELNYEISIYKWREAYSQINQRLTIGSDERVLVKWHKKKDELVEVDVHSLNTNGGLYKDVPIKYWHALLPSNVIGYSSGQNELISNPFIKLDYHYFDEFVKSTQSKEYIDTNTDVNRMFYMDYESNELILIANYLFEQKPTTLKNLKEDINLKIGIEELHSFGLKIQFKNYDSKLINYPSEIILGIEKLKKCATTLHDNGKEIKSKQNRSIDLHFFSDIGLKKAFRNQFKTSFELFRLFYLLRLMNIHCISPTSRKKIQEAPRNTNLSDLIPKPEVERLAFKVVDICFRKRNTKEPVRYKQLSDGEHQLLHIIGTLKIMKLNDVLFLLDEPETHFNPAWRAKMIRLIMELNQEEQLEQDHFITSHSPFIISDSKPTNVYLFHKKNGKLKVQTAHDIPFNTFGTSVNILTEEVFNKNESQGEYSGITINELMNRKYKTKEEIQKAKEDARILGDSVEKTLLFRKLIMKEDELKKKKRK
jgi:restriction system-associated AAA family ATPase